MTIHLLHYERLELNVAVFALGCLILVVGLARDILNAKVPASAITIAMFLGIILGPHVANVIKTGSMENSEIVVQEVSKLVIAIQLMAIALNIPYNYLTKAWLTQAVLLTVVVALMWLTSGFIIYAFFQSATGAYKFSIWEALLIGASVAPTDPVLASAVSTSALAISQVPARLRHTITAESGLNDGTGYPFVMLCLRFLTNHGKDSAGKIVGEWFAQDILWEVVVAVIIAIASGFAIGKLLVYSEPAKLHDQQLLVALTIALAFAFMGGAFLLGINGLILVVVGGVVYARVVEGDKRGTESQLQETVDLIFSTLVFAIFGLIIPFDKWHLVGWWRGILICICLALFRRVPWILVLKPIFKEQIHSTPDALFVGWFGPIGVGAIFYALYASEYLGNDDRTWVVVSIIVFSQVIIFGVTDTFFTRLYARTNPNYIRRRRRKQRVLDQAETQIIHIQEHVAQALESMHPSPELGSEHSWDNGDISELELGEVIPGSPRSVESQEPRNEEEDEPIDIGTEMLEFHERRSALAHSHSNVHASGAHSGVTSREVSFRERSDGDSDGGNDQPTDDVTHNTIMNTSRRLLDRAIGRSQAHDSHSPRELHDPRAISQSHFDSTVRFDMRPLQYSGGIHPRTPSSPRSTATPRAELVSHSRGGLDDVIFIEPGQYELENGNNENLNEDTNLGNRNVADDSYGILPRNNLPSFQLRKNSSFNSTTDHQRGHQMTDLSHNAESSESRTMQRRRSSLPHLVLMRKFNDARRASHD